MSFDRFCCPAFSAACRGQGKISPSMKEDLKELGAVFSEEIEDLNFDHTVLKQKHAELQNALLAQSWSTLNPAPNNDFISKDPQIVQLDKNECQTSGPLDTLLLEPCLLEDNNCKCHHHYNNLSRDPPVANGTWLPKFDLTLQLPLNPNFIPNISIFDPDSMMMLEGSWASTFPALPTPTVNYTLPGWPNSTGVNPIQNYIFDTYTESKNSDNTFQLFFSGEVLGCYSDCIFTSLICS